MKHRVPIFMLAVATALLAACGGGGPNTGIIQVRWKLGGFDVNCDAPQARDAQNRIPDTVRIRVIHAQKNVEVVPSQAFACSSKSAILSNIPAGTYNLVLELGVGATFTQPIFTGTVGGVAVIAGKTADVGTVVLEKIPEAVDPGGLRIDWDVGGRCGSVGVVTIRLQVWRELVFKQNEQTLDCDSPAVQLQVPPGRYGIIAEGLDQTGKVIRRGTEQNVQVQAAGQTVDVTVVLAPVP